MLSTVAPGLVLIDKPVGPTSFRMVQLVKRAFEIKKVGHSGTLDPFASGLLVICFGRAATKAIPQFMAGEKEYTAALRLGVETDSQDLTGTVIRRSPVQAFARGEVEGCLRRFVGEQLQRPPSFSALKFQGKPLYYYARRGIEVEKGPRPVFIREIETVDLQGDLLQIRVVCGKGTYIRALAADIGAALGCGAHLVALRRWRSGPFAVADAVAGDALLAHDRQGAYELLRKNMQPIADLIAGCGKNV